MDPNKFSGLINAVLDPNDVIRKAAEVCWLSPIQLLNKWLDNFVFLKFNKISFEMNYWNF